MARWSVVGDPMFGRHHARIIELALRFQVRSVFGGREFSLPAV